MDGIKKWLRLVAKYVVTLTKMLSVFFWLKDIKDAFLRRPRKSSMKEGSYS